MGWDLVGMTMQIKKDLSCLHCHSFFSSTIGGTELVISTAATKHLPCFLSPSLRFHDKFFISANRALNGVVAVGRIQ